MSHIQLADAPDSWFDTIGANRKRLLREALEVEAEARRAGRA